MLIFEHVKPKRKRSRKRVLWCRELEWAIAHSEVSVVTEKTCHDRVPGPGSRQATPCQDRVPQ